MDDLERKARMLRDLHEGGSTRAGRVLRRAEAQQASLLHEILREKAEAIGRAWRKVEVAYEALEENDDGDRRDRAREARWELVVHREALGLTDHRDVEDAFPLNRVGLVQERRRRATRDTASG